MSQANSSRHPELQTGRWELLEQINAVVDRPMTFLAFVWLGLLILDFIQGLSPLLQILSNVIWALFILDFVLEFTIAPKKLAYLRGNWLTALALALPALRVLRVARFVRVAQAARAARATRSVGLVRLVTSLNRSIGALRRGMARRGFGYVLALTAVVTFGGAAGMVLFESPRALSEAGYEGRGLESYGEAVWWTAMIITSLGSEYWPRTPEGRLVCLFLALYGFAVFGYITATVASYFVGRDREESASAGETALREEIAALRQELAALGARLQETARPERTS